MFKKQLKKENRISFGVCDFLMHEKIHTTVLCYKNSTARRSAIFLYTSYWGSFRIYSMIVSYITTAPLVTYPIAYQPIPSGFHPMDAR